MKRALTIQEMALVGMCAALMGIFSQLAIPIPFSAVPLTLQTFGVVVIAVILEHKLGALSMIIWTLIGAVGLPVFAGFAGGMGALLGPTGGYIIGFIVMTFIIGFAASGKNKVLLFAAAYIGQAVQYAFGVIQMKNVLGLSWNEALVAGVYPFAVKDIIVVTAAVIVSLIIKKALKGVVTKYVKA